MRLFPLLLLPAALACSSAPDTPAATATALNLADPRQPADPVETFEAGTKPAYEAGPAQLGTGPWLLTEALIGTSGQDHKRDGRAARLREGGRLSMQFDAPAGLRTVVVLAATYGHDGPSTWELWLSRDHGRSYQRQGPPQTTRSATPQPVAFAGLPAGPLRLEFRKTGPDHNRLNLDNILLGRGNGPTTPLNPAQPPPGSSQPPQSQAGPSQATQPQAGPNQTPKPLSPQAPDDDNLLLGNPSGATADPANATNYLLVRPQFAIGYNARRGTPTWTAWHVGRADLTKAAPRQDDFRPDPGLPRQFYQVTPQSYAGSGFDKGHNCPSGDRTASLDDNSATFLMSNMVPQAPRNNQQTWSGLEEYTRQQVRQGQEAYVLMGSYGRGGTGRQGPQQTLDQGRLTVPARLWKVIVLLPEGRQDLQRIAAGQARLLAIDTPNDESVAPDWQQYRTTVDKIEAATGLDLLSALPPATQARLQQAADGGR